MVYHMSHHHTQEKKAFRLTEFLGELIIFVSLQLMFVFVIFQTRPSFSLLWSTVLSHVIYLVALIVAVWFRHVHATHVMHHVISQYIPLGIHLWLFWHVGRDSVMYADSYPFVLWDRLLTMVVWTILIMLVIAFGEGLFHRWYREGR